MICIKNLKLLLLIISLMCSVHVMAQEGSRIKDVDILEEQKRALIKDYPHHFAKVTITNVEQINPKHSKVYYTNEGENYEAVVNSNRKDLLLIATSREITVAELPAIVHDVFKESNGDKKIKKAFVISTPYSSNFYRIDIHQKENATKSFFYDKMGQYEKPPY